MTEGLYAVTELLAWDEAMNRIYFMATQENRPGVRHLYSTDTFGNKSITCQTCVLQVEITHVVINVYVELDC